MKWLDWLTPFDNQVDNTLWRPVWDWVDSLLCWIDRIRDRWDLR